MISRGRVVKHSNNENFDSYFRDHISFLYIDFFFLTLEEDSTISNILTTARFQQMSRANRKKE